MNTITVRFGGKKGKSLWKLEESPNLLAVRSKTRQPLARVRFKDPANSALLHYECKLSAPSAGVEVLNVASVKTRNSFRKSMATEPEIQFAGRVLRTSETGMPVLYTENLFVKLTDSMEDIACRRLLEKHGLTIGRALGFARNAFFVKAPEGCGLKVFNYQDLLFSDNAVELCHPELVMEKSTRAANPNQWHLKSALINGVTVDQHASVEATWPLSVGSGVTIAVIDDGFDLGHPEFAQENKVVAPRDVTRQTNDPRPGAGDDHGTACAGVACANGTGSPGASGVAPAARLMPIRNVSLLGSVAEAEAFYHAADNGADVISCSWGPTDGDWQDPSDPLHHTVVPLPDSTRLAIDYCIQNGRNGKGCIITWAAGNGNESADNDGYASYEKVISVAACNDRGKKSGYSDFGSSIWCAFPSSELINGLTPGIWTVDRRGTAGYNRGFAQLGDPAGHYTNDFGGTSSACPGAAGIAALILSVHPGLRWDEVRQIMADTADKIDSTGGGYNAAGHSKLYGFGRLNALKAVQKAISLGGSPQPMVVDVPQPKVAAARRPAGARLEDILASYITTQKIQAKTVSMLVQSMIRSRATAGFKQQGKRNGGGGATFTRDEVFFRLREVVYHDAAKDPSDIGVDDQIEGDLGYEGTSKRALAGRTNNAFGLVDPERMIGDDFDDLDTFGEHHEATCEHLEKLGRLEDA